MCGCTASDEHIREIELLKAQIEELETLRKKEVRLEQEENRILINKLESLDKKMLHQSKQWSIINAEYQKRLLSAHQVGSVHFFFFVLC